MCERPLQLILIHVFDFFRLDAQIIDSLALRAGWLWSAAENPVGVKGHVMANVPDLPDPYICRRHVYSF